MSALDKCFWGYGMVCLELTEPLWCRCNHLSQQWKLQQPARKLSIYGKKSREITGEWHAKGDTEARCKERKWELFISSPLTASPLTCTFICHSKWTGCSQSYSVNQHKNSSYLRTKQCPLWLHVSFFNKKSSHTRGTTTPKCTLPWHLVQPCNSHLLQSTPPSAEPHYEFWYGHLDFDKTITWWLKIRQKKGQTPSHFFYFLDKRIKIIQLTPDNSNPR